MLKPPEFRSKYRAPTWKERMENTSTHIKMVLTLIIFLCVTLVVLWFRDYGVQRYIAPLILRKK